MFNNTSKASNWNVIASFISCQLAGLFQLQKLSLRVYCFPITIRSNLICSNQKLYLHNKNFFETLEQIVDATEISYIDKQKNIFSGVVVILTNFSIFEYLAVRIGGVDHLLRRSFVRGKCLLLANILHCLTLRFCCVRQTALTLSSEHARIACLQTPTLTYYIVVIKKESATCL